jgi:hypothetical protein
MPVSKPRRRPKSRRGAAPNGEVGVSGSTSGRKLTPAQYERRQRLGWWLVALGVVVFSQHLISHMGFFTVVSSGWDDLLIGYPVAGLLATGGGVLLSKT